MSQLATGGAEVAPRLLNDLVNAGILKEVPASTGGNETNIGELLADLRNVRDQKDKLNEALGALAKQELAIKAKAMAYHEATGLSQIGDERLTVSFAAKMRPRVDPEKWEAVMRWAVDTGNWHILYKQLCQDKVVELATSGTALPDGMTIEGFTDWRVTRKGK